MLRKMICLAVVVVLGVCVVAQASLFYDDFEGEGGLAAQGWVIEGSLWGGAGCDPYYWEPYPPSSIHWCYFQVDATNGSGIYVDTGVAVEDNKTYTLSYTTGTNTTGWPTASMWAQVFAGNPYDGGVWLGGEGTYAPPSLETASHSFDAVSGVGKTGNLFIRFGVTNTAEVFEQPILDNVMLVIPEPATMILLGVGSALLLRRKRN